MKQIYPMNNELFFNNVFLKIIKLPNAQYPNKEVKIKVRDDFYKFMFDWIDENSCGIDVFKLENGEENVQTENM